MEKFQRDFIEESHCPLKEQFTNKHNLVHKHIIQFPPFALIEFIVMGLLTSILFRRVS